MLFSKVRGTAGKDSSTTQEPSLAAPICEAVEVDDDETWSGGQDVTTDEYNGDISDSRLDGGILSSNSNPIPTQTKSPPPTSPQISQEQYPGFQTYAINTPHRNTSNGIASFSYTLAAGASGIGGAGAGATGTEEADNEADVSMLRVYVQQLYNENLQLRSQQGVGPAQGGIQKLVKMEKQLDQLVREYRQAQVLEKQQEQHKQALQTQVNAIRQELRKRQESANTKRGHVILAQHRLHENNNVIQSMKIQAEQLNKQNQLLSQCLRQKDNEVRQLEQALQGVPVRGAGGGLQDPFALQRVSADNRKILRQIHEIQKMISDMETAQIGREQYILNLEQDCIKLRQGTTHMPFSSNTPPPPPQATNTLPHHAHTMPLHLHGPMGPRSGPIGPQGPMFGMKGDILPGGGMGPFGPHPGAPVPGPRGVAASEMGGPAVRVPQTMERLKKQLLEKDSKLVGMKKDVESIAGKSRQLIKALQDKLQATEAVNDQYQERVSVLKAKGIKIAGLDGVGNQGGSGDQAGGLTVDEEEFLNKFVAEKGGTVGGFEFPAVSGK